MTERELVKLVTVDSVRPVANADALDLVSVGGWNVVSQKGLYNPGDQAWYFEIDSLLPLDNPAFAFLAARGVREYEGRPYHRLKTVKLRGQISQGLLVPYAELSVAAGGTYTEALGVLKFDDVFTVNAGNGDTAGSFPSQFGSKTDAERVQNLSGVWSQIQAERSEWMPTEKIDGCSLSVFRDFEGNLRVCSRNWEVKDGGNVYWNAVRQYQSLVDLLPPGDGFQAEIYGEGIQGNRLGIKGKRIAVFNYTSGGSALGYDDWPDKFLHEATDANLAPIFTDSAGHTLSLPETLEEAVAQADGIKSTISKDRLAEGIVWTHRDGKVLLDLGRHCFKVVSNKWLLKNE